MPGRDVDGLLLPVKVANHPALELCNTRGWWGSDKPNEYLRSWAHAETLARDLPVVDYSTRSASNSDDEDMLASLLRLREDLYSVVTSDDAPARRIRRLDATMRAGVRDLEFLGMSGGNPEWRSRSEGAQAILHGFARAAADLLAQPRRISACPRCGWVFLDPSGRRKWCSMKWCGNREKVAQHAKRAQHDGVTA